MLCNNDATEVIRVDLINRSSILVSLIFQNYYYYSFITCHVGTPQRGTKHLTRYKVQRITLPMKFKHYTDSSITVCLIAALVLAHELFLSDLTENGKYQILQYIIIIMLPVILYL